MVDLTRLEAVCQKKLNARVLQEIRDTVEHIPDDETGDLFWAGIKFLLQREKLIDEALAAEPEKPSTNDDDDLQAAESIRYHQARELDELQGLA